MNKTILMAMVAVILVALSGCIILESKDTHAATDGTTLNDAWLSTNSYTMSEGTYYLENNLTVTESITVSGNVSLNLNSKTLIYIGTGSAFIINGTSALTLLGGATIKTDNGTTVAMSDSASLTIGSNLSISGTMTGSSSLTVTEGASSGALLKSNLSIESTCTVTNNGTLNIYRTGLNDKDIEVTGEGTTVEYLFEGDNAVLTKVSMGEKSTKTFYSIPKNVDNHPVIGIASDAFADNERITAVSSTVNSPLVSIGNGAFEDCSNLATITLRTITSIGNGAFIGCDSLKSITLSANCEYGAGAFSGVPATATVTLGSDTFVVTNDGNLTTQNPDDAKFQVGDSYFITIESALNAASDNETVTMLSDYEIGPLSIEKTGLKLDLGTYTLTITGETTKPGISFFGSSFYITNGSIHDARDSARGGNCTTIQVENNQNLTIEDVNISILDGTSANNTAFWISNGASLKLTGTTSITSDDENGTLTGSIGVVILGTGNMTNTTDLVIAGDVKIQTTQYGIAGNGSIGADEDFTGTNISISGNATVSASRGWGIYHPQMGILSISENATVSGRTGIEMRSGILDITGGSVTSVDSETTMTDIDSGGSVYGAAIVVSQHSSDQEISVRISGGEFEGPHAFYETDVYDGEPEKVGIAITGGSFTGTTAPIYAADAKSDSGEPAISGFILGGEFYTSTGGTPVKVDSLDYIAPGYVYDDGKFETDESYKAVASNGNGKVYDDFREAISDARAGDTVTLLDSITVDLWTQLWGVGNITVEGQGNTITIGSIDGGDFIMIESAGSNIFKNMTVDISAVTNAAARAFSASPGDVFENVNIIGNPNVSGISTSGSDAEGEGIEIAGCTFSNLEYALVNDETGKLESMMIDGCTFDECTRVGILYSEDTEFKNNTVNGGQINVMHPGQSITDNAFTNGSTVKFYETDAEFSNNSISTDSKIDVNDPEAQDTKLDVSGNYWGGGEPSEFQLGNSASIVQGSEDYFIDNDMTLKPEDAGDNHIVNGGEYNLSIDGNRFVSTADLNAKAAINLTFRSGATISFTGTTGSEAVIISIEPVTDTAYEANHLYEVTVEGISADTDEYRIGLPYSIEDGYRLDSLKVYFYSEDEEPEDMDARWSNGLATFTTDHNSLYGIVLTTSIVEPEPTPGDEDTPAVNPPVTDDDEYIPLPPVVVEESYSNDDTVKVVACAAAAVVAALMAAFLIISRRD